MFTTEQQERVQILVYIRRRPGLTQEQFYKHWQDVHAPTVAPWAEKHGFERYQQMHVSGLMIPNVTITTIKGISMPVEPLTTQSEFDGIAVFVVPSLQHFDNAFKDPYYIEVIEPDERKFVDKEGSDGGVVAKFRGKMLDIGLNQKRSLGTTGASEEYRKAFVRFEKEQSRGSIMGTGKPKL